MEILKQLDKELTAERILSCLPGEATDLYEDDADDLMEQLCDADAIHPAAAYAEITVNQVIGQSVVCEKATITSSLFEGNCQTGDSVYPCLLTVGTKMDAFAASLDDPMLSYLQGMVMNLSLDDALLSVAGKIMKEHPGKKLLMIKPGIAEICELSEQNSILALLDHAAETLGVTVSEHGFLTPGYSGTALLFFSEKGVECPTDWQNEEDRKRFVHELNSIAGHI